MWQFSKGWLAIAKLKPLLLFISLLSMLKKAFDNVEKEKWKVIVVLALQWLASPFNNRSLCDKHAWVSLIQMSFGFLPFEGMLKAQLRGHLLQSLGRHFFSLTSADNCAAVFIAIKAEPDFQVKWNYSLLSHDNASFEWQLLMAGGIPCGFARVRILHFLWALYF